MLVSIVVRTKDEAHRLRLVLASLSRQTIPIIEAGSHLHSEQAAFELIVVNDGSTDQTPAVLQEAAGHLPLLAVHHAKALGRSAASNAGARRAAGDLLLFLDGDTLAGPVMAERHAQRHAKSEHAAGRGETFHLRCTRWFLDPETGTPQPGREEQVRRLGADLGRCLVTRSQVLEHFEEIEGRAEHGVYPGAAPRLLAELEMDALHNHPDLSVLWMAAAGSNFSVRRRDFEEVGGFDDKVIINEHRELAFRLMEKGVRLVPVVGTRTYHLTHRVGWRDPLEATDWEEIFFAAHPCLAVKLMAIFWLSLSGSPAIPNEARITSLPRMDALVRDGTTIDYDAIRRAHPHLTRLGVAP